MTHPSPRPRRRLFALLAAVVAIALTPPTVAAVAAVAQPTAGAWSSRTAGGMTTQLYVPTSAPELAAGRALMINLHGCVQTATDLKGGGNWAATADERGMVVAVPAAPNGGVLLGCWDYYDTSHSRANPARHDDNLLQLVDDLLGDASLGIDPNQVYLTGLSSGGGETMVMGCLAPDVFAGIGINAGPSVGTTSGQIGYVATSQAQATSTCRNFASTGSPGFSTQLTSVIYGSSDTTVATGYNTLNAQVMAGIYGASTQSSFSLASLPGSNTAGTGTLWSDAAGPRVSLIANSNVGHAWPAGGGPGGSYISTSSVSYPAYVTDFFFDNNRRVDRTGGPTNPPTDPPTDPPTEPGLFCGAATNAQHQAAGRATSYGIDPYNPFYAVGSLDYLGQGNATVTTLRETSEGVFDLVTGC